MLILSFFSPPVTPRRKLSTIERYLVTPPTAKSKLPEVKSPRKKLCVIDDNKPKVPSEKPNAFAIMMKRSKEMNEERKLKRKALF